MEFSKKDMRFTYGQTLVELGELYDNIVVLDADLCTSTMTSLFRDRFPKRFFQCGIAEGNMFGIAAGMAERGYTVFPSTFAAFAARRAADPIYTQICGHNANVKIPGSYPGLTATECGMSHNCCEDVGVFASYPNMKVLMPGDDRELRSAMCQMMLEPGPVYFRVPKITAPVLFDDSYKFQWGKGYELISGNDVSLVCAGMMTGIAIAAANLLEKDGIHARVIHMPSVKPLDEELLDKCAEETGLIVTLENARAFGNFGSIIADHVSKKGKCRVEKIGIERETFAQSDNLYNLLVYNKLTPGNIAERVKQALNQN